MPDSPPKPASHANRPCNPTQPGATARNRMQPPIAFGKTNPIFTADPDPTNPLRNALRRATESVVTAMAPLASAACNPMQPGATPRNAVQPIPEMRKTNPIPPSDPFDARQLAAARLLAAGRSIPDVARELKLSRTTVWRWQREPAFRAELRRIHERMITPEPARTVRAAGSAPPARGATRGWT